MSESEIGRPVSSARFAGEPQCQHTSSELDTVIVLIATERVGLVDLCRVGKLSIRLEVAGLWREARERKSTSVLLTSERDRDPPPRKCT